MSKLGSPQFNLLELSLRAEGREKSKYQRSYAQVIHLLEWILRWETTVARWVPKPCRPTVQLVLFILAISMVLLATAVRTIRPIYLEYSPDITGPPSSAISRTELQIRLQWVRFDPTVPTITMVAGTMETLFGRARFRQLTSTRVAVKPAAALQPVQEPAIALMCG